MERKRYQGLEQLSDEQQKTAKRIASAPPEASYEAHPGNRFEGDTRIEEVARIMIEGCMMDRYTFGCMECIFFDTGRSICMDVLKEEIDRL